jgi:hypothetical protein
MIVSTKENATYVAITRKMEPKTTHLYQPKIETIEFLCYIASILGLWFGFSFLSIQLWLEKIFIIFDNMNIKIKFLNKRLYKKKIESTLRFKHKY